MTIDQAITHIGESFDTLVPVDSDGFSASALVDRLNDSGYHAIVIDRAPVVDKDTLMHAFYQNVGFPGYFGFTWDALVDMLAGIDGRREGGFAFTFSDFSLIDEDTREQLIDVIEEANELRQGKDELAKLRIVALKV